MKFLFILLFPFCVSAQVFDLTEEEINPETREILLNKPEKYLRHESMMYDLDTDSGLTGERYYTGTDRNRLSLAGHLSANYENLNNLMGFEINLMRRTTRFHQVWWGVQLLQHKTYFTNLTQNHEFSSTPNTEGNFQRSNDIENTLTALGAGIGYRFKFLAGIINSESTFETVDVFFNGVQLQEDFVDKTYKGYGLTTNYGIHKRSGYHFFYGGKFSYNLASVSRDAIQNESKSERSLSLGWGSIAFEMGFFY
jgi:hypothetical protein